MQEVVYERVIGLGDSASIPGQNHPDGNRDKRYQTERQENSVHKSPV
jgi:hypothetical protein